MEQIIKTEIEVTTPTKLQLPKLSAPWRVPLLKRSKVNLVNAGRGSGKTTFALYLMLEANAQGKRAHYIGTPGGAKRMTEMWRKHPNNPFGSLPHINSVSELIHDGLDLIVVDDIEFAKQDAIQNIFRYFPNAEIWLLRGDSQIGLLFDCLPTSPPAFMHSTVSTLACEHVTDDYIHKMKVFYKDTAFSNYFIF